MGIKTGDFFTINKFALSLFVCAKDLFMNDKDITFLSFYLFF